MSATHPTAVVGGVMLIAITAGAVGAPWIAPHRPDESFRGLLNAPPTAVHLRDTTGSWHAPFTYRWRVVNQLEQQYAPITDRRIPLVFFSDGHLVRSSDEAVAPLLLLGADSYGRDVLARTLFGARTSLGLAAVAALGALLLGVAFGGVAGYGGGVVDEVVMRAADFLMILPTIYVALALRAMLPLVLAPGTVFVLLATIFSILGTPVIGRGVRAIVHAEKSREYVEAARSLGAGPARLLLMHLLPATRGYLAVQVTLLVPAFVIAEATLSFVGLGFPDQTASWGTMLHDASNVRVFADFPWLLSPAAAMFVVVVALNLVLERRNGWRGFRVPGQAAFDARQRGAALE